MSIESILFIFILFQIIYSWFLFKIIRKATETKLKLKYQKIYLYLLVEIAKKNGIDVEEIKNILDDK